MTDFTSAVSGLRENMRNLDGVESREGSALSNISNALLVFCEALEAQDRELARIEAKAQIAMTR